MIAFSVQVILSVIGVIFVAPISGLFTSLFPVSSRYSGVALGITSGQALLGGTTPLIATYLMEVNGNLASASLYIMATSIIGYVSLQKFTRFSPDQLY